MASIVKSCAISGVDGYVVDVETKTIVGQPMISIVGLGDTAVKEARERCILRFFSAPKPVKLCIASAEIVQSFRTN